MPKYEVVRLNSRGLRVGETVFASDDYYSAKKAFKDQENRRAAEDDGEWLALYEDGELKNPDNRMHPKPGAVNGPVTTRKRPTPSAFQARAPGPAAPAPAPAPAQSLRDRLIAKGAVDTLPRKPQTPASESSEEESSDESGSEYSEDGPDWIEGWDPNHKHVYYFNHVTEVTTWARPNNEEVRPMSAKDAARRREDLLNK